MAVSTYFDEVINQQPEQFFNLYKLCLQNIIGSVLTDYKYSLKKKIQRRIANTTQGGSEILASLSDLETEALQASLLDWDFADGDKSLSETPPPDGSQNLSDDMLQTSTSESQETTSSNNLLPNINGNSANMETAINQIVNGSNGNPNDSAVSIKTENDLAPSISTPNGITQVQPATSSLPAESTQAQQNITPLQPVPVTDIINGAHYIKVLEDGTQEIQQLPVPFPTGQDVAASVPQVVQAPQSDSSLPIALVPIKMEVDSGAQPAISTPAPVIPQHLDSAETNNSVQLPQTQLTPDAIQATMSQPSVQFATPTQAQLTNEEMNKLIAREIDRMASTQKRKTTQRKRETREKTRSDNTAAKDQKSSQNQSSVQSSTTAAGTTQPKEKTRKTTEPRRQPQKRPRPKPLASASNGTAAGSSRDGQRPEKRMLSSREFRHCLLQLLAEANEMEKRRIAITETKVRNQTEIQNLEITRMNLEIMKLQKEITLLDHGAKILP